MRESCRENTSSRGISFFLFVAVLGCLSSPILAVYTPWDPLVADNWAWTAANPNGDILVNLYTVNGGYNSGVYPILFEPKKNNGAARGHNALKFRYGGSETGHLASTNLSDSFQVLNTGDNNIFDYVILGIAIDSPSLPGDFSMTLDVTGANNFSTSAQDHFVYYDATGNDTGRPSGYHSLTDPTTESLAYDFSAGMTCLVDTGATLQPLGGSITVDYTFTNLPGRAVFCVYAFVSTEDPAGLHHTNRAITDNNDPAAALSTFEVIPEPATCLLLLSALPLLLRPSLLRRR